MMKNMFKISTISVLCALGAVMTTGAMAAGTVRSLGGTGTYNGTAAASTSTRAGSLRVLPGAARLVTNSDTESQGDVASGSNGVRASGTQQRLSIGKYLGGSVTTSASSVGNRATAESIDNLEGNVNRIEDVLDKMRNGTSDGVIEIADDGTISLNVEVLKPLLSDSDDVEFDYDVDSHELSWRTHGSTNWNLILDVDSLASASTLGELQSALTDGLALKADKSALDTLSSKVGDGSLPAEINGTAVTNIVSAINALKTKTDSMALNSSITAVQSDIADIQTSISDIATVRAGASAGATAVQPAQITTGSANGTIAVNGTNVPVRGLGSAAYTVSTDYIPVSKDSTGTSGIEVLTRVVDGNGNYTYSWETIKR